MRLLLLATVCITYLSSAQAQSDPLPSWNDGANKRAIIEFVHAARIRRLLHVRLVGPGA